MAFTRTKRRCGMIVDVYEFQMELSTAQKDFQ